MAKKYVTGTRRYKIEGKLRKTSRTVRPIRCGKRSIHKDNADKLWVKCFNKWWKFPEEIEY